MALISYKEFMAARESTAAKRAKKAAAQGLQARNTADIYGGGVSPPWVYDKLRRMPRINSPGGEPIQEKHEIRPDYSFDRLIRKAASASQEIDSDLDKAQKQANQIDKEKAQKEKQRKKDVKPDKKHPPHEPEEKDSEEEKEKEKDQDNDEGQDKDEDQPTPVQKPIKPKNPVFDRKLSLTPIKDKKVPRNGDHEKFKEETEWLYLLGNTSFDPRVST